MPDLTSLPSFFRQRRTRKVNGMKTPQHMKLPQQLSRQAIEEFKAIYQDEFGQILTDDEVQQIAHRLLRFFGILDQPLSDQVEAK